LLVFLLAIARRQFEMTDEELAKWQKAISELQAAVGNAPRPTPSAIKAFREIEAAFRADPRCTADIEERLEAVEDGMSYWFGDQDWRELTFSLEQQRTILLKSLEKLKLAASSQLG
jgi:hypothetical protein